MKIRALNLNKVVRYQLTIDEDAGTDNAVTWVIGALDSRVLASIKDKATGIPMSALAGGTEGTATLNLNQTNFDVVVYGLKNFENFKYEDGKSVEYKTVTNNLNGRAYTTVDPDIVKMLPPEVIDELAGAIMEINTLSDTERKNSVE